MRGDYRQGRQAMTPAQSAAFQAGSGVTLGRLLTSTASVVPVLVFVWVMWVTVGMFRSWQDGQVALFDLVWATLRASSVPLVLGFYLRSRGRRNRLGPGVRPGM